MGILDRVNKLLTPYNFTPNRITRIRYIVIHYVGATGGAYANCKYYASQKLNASAHYFVGFEGEIWQSVEDANIAWSVGGKKYPDTQGGQYYGVCTNTNSLNIEMCVRKNDKGWYFEDATVQSTIELTKALMTKYHVDANHVIRHYGVTGKDCPAPYVKNNTKHTWWDFKRAIAEPDIKTGWVEESNGWHFYLGPTRDVRNDWYYDSNHRWAWFDGSGVALRNQWYEYKGKWYWFRDDCYSAESEWITYNGHDYYLTADGSMAVSAYVKSKDPNSQNYYWINTDGIYEPQWTTTAPDLDKYTVVI